MKPTVKAAAMLLVLCMARPALAEPAWGKNCLSCHGQLQTSSLFVFGEDTTADPDESATGAPDRGTLPVFQVYRGQAKTLQAEVVDLVTDDTYAVELRRLRFDGVENGVQLTYTGDCNWPEWGEDANYYSDPVVAYRWGAGPTTFTFEISVDSATTPDYFDLVFAVAGKLADDGGLFYAEEHFYLQVLNVLGDLNGDCLRDMTDFSLFASAYGSAMASPSYDPDADINADGVVDFGDFVIFIGLYGVPCA
jgi:hypothetical protein